MTLREIDPLGAIIAHLRADALLRNLTDDRIAAKHQFGSGWTVGSAAVTVHLDGGDTDNEVLMHTPVHIEARCFGGSQIEAMSVWREVRRIFEDTDRDLVTTARGSALIYYILPMINPMPLFDPEIGQDFVYVTARADIARAEIT